MSPFNNNNTYRTNALTALYSDEEGYSERQGYHEVVGLSGTIQITQNSTG